MFKKNWKRIFWKWRKKPQYVRNLNIHPYVHTFHSFFVRITEYNKICITRLLHHHSYMQSKQYKLLHCENKAKLFFIQFLRSLKTTDVYAKYHVDGQLCLIRNQVLFSPCWNDVTLIAFSQLFLMPGLHSRWDNMGQKQECERYICLVCHIFDHSCLISEHSERRW